MELEAPTEIKKFAHHSDSKVKTKQVSGKSANSFLWLGSAGKIGRKKKEGKAPRWGGDVQPDAKRRTLPGGKGRRRRQSYPPMFRKGKKHLEETKEKPQS